MLTHRGKHFGWPRLGPGPGLREGLGPLERPQRLGQPGPRQPRPPRQRRARRPWPRGGAADVCAVHSVPLLCFWSLGSFLWAIARLCFLEPFPPRGASQLEQNAVCESAQAAFSVERSAEVRLLAQKEFLGGQILGGPTVPKTQITRMA